MAVRITPIEAEREAIIYEISQVVEYLEEVLGQKIVAYLAGLADTKMVRAWTRGTSRPHPATEVRLRYAYQAARMLEDAYGEGTTRAWFFGSNRMLDDEAPAVLLRHAQTPEDVQLIVPAALSFVGTVG